MKCVNFVSSEHFTVKISNIIITQKNILIISFCTICTYLKFFVKLCQGFNLFQKNLIYNESIHQPQPLLDVK